MYSLRQTRRTNYVDVGRKAADKQTTFHHRLSITTITIKAFEDRVISYHQKRNLEGKR